MANDPVTDFQKLQKTFNEIGVKFDLTDDSEESDIEECLDTVIDIYDRKSNSHMLFAFHRDGSFKDCFAF